MTEISLIVTLNNQFTSPPYQSDFPPISWPLYRAWPSLNYEWFLWSIYNGCGWPAGNAYPSGHLVPSPILGLANAPIVETKFLELAMSLLDFSPRIPLVLLDFTWISVPLFEFPLFWLFWLPRLRTPFVTDLRSKVISERNCQKYDSN